MRIRHWGTAESTGPERLVLNDSNGFLNASKREKLALARGVQWHSSPKAFQVLLSYRNTHTHTQTKKTMLRSERPNSVWYQCQYRQLKKTETLDRPNSSQPLSCRDPWGFLCLFSITIYARVNSMGSFEQDLQTSSYFFQTLLRNERWFNIHLGVNIMGLVITLKREGGIHAGAKGAVPIAYSQDPKINISVCIKPERDQAKRSRFLKFWKVHS